MSSIRWPFHSVSGIIPNIGATARGRVRKWLEAERAEAKWKRARVELEKTHIRAAFDGVVSERYVRLGQRVTEDDTTPLFRITALEPLLARFYLPEVRLGQIHIGQSVIIRTGTGSLREYEGQVQWISPVVDPASGTFQALAEVMRPEGDSYLRPGLSVVVALALGPAHSTLRIERGALAEREIVREGIDAHLFVVENGRAVVRSVRVGRINGSEVEILSGLNAGEDVIRRFRSDLHDGEPVRKAGSL